MSLVSPGTLIREADSVALSEIHGIYPTDLVVKTAIEFGLQDLRANPAQLEHVFASLLADTETSRSFGQKECQNAINYFTKTEIPVLWDLRLALDTFPSVSYALAGDDEQEFTLADIHYQTQEDTKAEWEPLTPRFSPSYEPSTGLVTVPANISKMIWPTDVMSLVAGDGTAHPIIEEISGSQFLIAPNLTVDLRNSVLKNTGTRLISNIESSNFKQTVRVGCHTVGDPVYVLYLHAIVKYCLLRYRRTLLEARGFERSTISSGPPQKDERFQVENLFTRYITLTGVVRDSWQAAQTERIAAVSAAKTVAANGDSTGGLNMSPAGKTQTLAQFLYQSQKIRSQPGIRWTP